MPLYAPALIVEEEDGGPSVSGVTKIQVTNGELTHDGGGVVSFDVGGAGGGGTGQGLVDFASLKYTAGDITCDADSVWEDLGLSDLTLTAASGDWIEVGFSGTCPNTTSVSLDFDVGTIVSAAVVNHIGTGTTPDNGAFGVQCWRINGGAALSAGGSILYQLQAGDITAGTVVLRIRDKPESSTNRVLGATANFPLHFWAKNLGASL